ncbi:uncharacterized protein JCM15063_000829 [Sporobolomyces koalae]|uniref:uncharacterized protein n=1 Tax=Sporobolomyces koalae TaxID=500713 RepID=UPI00316E2072
MRLSKSLLVVLSGVATLVSAQSSSSTFKTDGSLSNGPSAQGTCQRLSSRSDVFECSNGATCRWSTESLSFACTSTSTTSTGGGTNSTTSGPPGRQCRAHKDHWDCSDGSFCELVQGAWFCEGGSSSSSAADSGSGSSTCIVHGGHTHGDCSGKCNGVDLGEYDLDLHIVALFVVLVGSLVGVLLPVICSNVLQGAVFRAIFFAAKHFGTGVIVCTAFIHLLYHAFVMFGNACLGELHFEPAAAAISLAGVYVTFSVDFFVMRWLRDRGDRRANRLAVKNQDGAVVSSSASSTEEKMDLGHSHGSAQEADQMDYASKQAHFDVLILEAGILFHSIMIGVSLGASGGDQWTPLFIAIVFHQLFEGLALGSRIGQLEWKSGQGWKKWAMAGAFGLITPIGIAIGMGVHSTYNPNSGASLLSIGILDSISAGILIYGGLVECLYHDFMHGSLARANLGRVFLALFFVLAGSLCMAVLGKWA